MSAIAAVFMLVTGLRSADAVEASGPRVFLNCAADCSESYLRQKLSYFELVRDRHQARYEVLIAAQPSGGGGVTYNLTLITRENEPLPSRPRKPRSPDPASRGAAPDVASPDRGAQGTLVRRLTRRPGQALVAFRAELLDQLLRLLYAALSDTEHEAQFQLTLPARSVASLGRLDDPWDYWVIIPELSGEGEGGSGYYFAQLGGNVTVRRITGRDKLRFRLSYEQWLSSFEFEDGSRISGNVSSAEANALYARSLGDHYAVGLTGALRSSEYENLELHLHYGPMFEANVFPYAQNASRQLRFVYQLGVWYNDYFERNSRDNSQELWHYHALSAISDVNQSWGSVQIAAQLNSFIEEPSLFRLALGGQLTLLLFEGLSLNFEGTSAWVRDQVSARLRPLEDDEILLFTAEQPTRFVVEATLGFSYAFGSIHNTIVNPRFGRVDLSED